MDRELVSIVIPVYNVPEVTTAVFSCLRQTYTDIEILVVDDGSDTDIRELLNKFKDDRIRIIRNIRHRNANVCRNQGIDMARGKYIAFLDSDDIFLPGHIESSLNCLKEIKTQGIYSSLIWHDGHTARECKAGLPFDNEKWANYLIRRGISAQTSTLFLTKESASAIRWDEEMTRHQDHDFVVRYTRTFRLGIKWESTVVYNADPHRTRPVTLDDLAFESCIKFSSANKEDISPRIYRWYIGGMLKLAKAHRAGEKIVKYYENELQ